MVEGEEGAYFPEDDPWRLYHLIWLNHCHLFHYLQCQEEVAGQTAEEVEVEEEVEDGEGEL